jgi:release factor glutamine methyltransferase
VGKQEFYGLDFKVCPGVLIPRPETELLVEAGLAILSSLEQASFLEVGVGSGCISISILYNVRNSVATAVDVADEPLMVAAANAHRHGVAERLVLKRGNVFEAIQGRYDLIVSNPPYIPLADLADLQPEVANFEPSDALFAGSNGLEIIRKLVEGAPGYLKAGGHLLIEIGHNQSKNVKSMLDPTVWETPEVILDLQRFERVVKSRLRA